MTSQLDRNKQTVTGFYDLMFNRCKPSEAVQKYVGDVYTQHNAQRRNGSARPSPVLSSGGRRKYCW